MKKIALLLSLLSMELSYCEAGQPLGITAIEIEPIGYAAHVKGVIIVTIEGGTAPYTYALNGISSGPTAHKEHIFSNVPANHYAIRVEDSSQSRQSAHSMVSVGGPLPLGVTAIEIENPPYGTSEGTITLVTKGGRDPVLFSIDGQSHGESGKFLGLCARTTPYTIVTSTQDGGPSHTYSIPLVGPAPVSVTSTSIPVLSSGDANGEITVTGITGGVPPYYISLDNGSLQSFTGRPVIFSSLFAGHHILTVCDKNCCWTTELLLVETPDPLMAVTEG